MHGSEASRRQIYLPTNKDWIYAPVAELADAPDLGSGVYDVGVRSLSGAPYNNPNFDKKLGLLFALNKAF